MIHIIGAGFSGLTLAWELKKLGILVTIYEKDQIGGLIQTYRTQTHLRETAANGILWNPRFEKLAQELNVEFQSTNKSSKKRFIYRNKLPRQWPLTFFESLFTFLMILKYLIFRFFKNQKNNQFTLEKWAEKVFGKPFTQIVLSVGVQGIFALEPSKLSAHAVLESFKVAPEFSKSKKYKSKTYAPVNGMSELIRALKDKLTQQGVLIHKKEIKGLTDLHLNYGDAIVIATSAWQASELIPDLKELRNISSIGLAKVTLVFNKSEPQLNGFGCLFPIKEDFFSAGVLFDSNIFANQGSNPAETWIINKDWQSYSDNELKMQVLNDRKKLFPLQNEPIECHITRWSRAIPAYDLSLNSFVNSYEKIAQVLKEKNLFLTGNYLGKIGLAKIYDQNIVLAQKIKANYE